MSKLIAMTFIAIALSSGHSLAQSHQPYAGLQSRSIKALSDDQIADLRAGRGMGLALAAELNGYPGPAHVLELADTLGLTPEQRARVGALFEQMKAEAVALGERLIVSESELDRLFASHRITPVSLAATTEVIGQTQSKLRETHLRYHLLTIELLSEDQLTRYSSLRGYSGSPHQHGQPHHQ